MHEVDRKVLFPLCSLAVVKNQPSIAPAVGYDACGDFKVNAGFQFRRTSRLSNYALLLEHHLTNILQ